MFENANTFKFKYIIELNNFRPDKDFEARIKTSSTHEDIYLPSEYTFNKSRESQCCNIS